MPPRTFRILTIGLLAVVGLLLWRACGTATLDAAGDAVGAATGPGREVVDAATPHKAPGPAAAAARSALSDTSGAGHATSGPAQAAADRGPARVTIGVVEAQTDSPVPFASVAVMTRDFDWATMTDQQRFQVRRFGDDRTALLAHFGTVHRADAEGRLELELAPNLHLACDDEGRFGQLSLDASKSGNAAEHRLVLAPTGNLRVRVIDGDGAPVADVPIRGQLHWRDPTADVRNRRRGDLGIRAYTGADGRAVLRHVERFLRPFLADDRPARLGLALDIIPEATEAASVDLLQPPAAEIELRAPPTGLVIVRVRDDRGEPIGSYEDTRLRLAGATGDEFYPWHAQPEGPGAARYPLVALDRVFRAEAILGIPVTPREFPGPRRAGEVVHIDLTTDAGATLLTGRVVDAQGAAAARAHLSMTFDADGYDGANFRLVTDATGRFRYGVDARMTGLQLRRVMFQRLVEWQPTPLCGALEVPIDLKPGRNDIGQVMLHPAPTLVTGRVEVDGAPPVDRPELLLEVRASEDEDPAAWRLPPGTTIRWGARGAFTVHCPIQPTAWYRIAARGPAFLPRDPLPFRPGTTDLLVDLRQGGTLRANLRVDDPADAYRVTVRLAPQETAGSPAPTPTSRPGRPDGPGRPAPVVDRGGAGVDPSLTWRGLAPGTWRLTIHAAGAAGPVFDLRDLVVRAGAACDDPRLRALDLRSKLHRVIITVTGARDRDLLGDLGAVWEGSGVDVLGAPLQHGRADLLVAGPVDLTLAASGYEIEHLTGVDASRAVRLRRLARLAVALPPVTIPDGSTLTMRGEPAGKPLDATVMRMHGRSSGLSVYTRPPMPHHRLGAGRIVEFPARADEDITLRVWLTYRGKTKDLDGCTPRICRVGQGGRVNLVVPADSIAAALASLRR